MTFPPGIAGASSVQLNAGQLAFLAALRRLTPSTTPIYVTSGTRSVEQQAAAMFEKYRLGGEGALRAVYPASTVALVLSAAPSPTSWAAAIANAAVSRHLRGDAVDLRSRGLTTAQIDGLVAAGQALGARVLVEDDPPHVHMERLGGGQSAPAQLLRSTSRLRALTPSAALVALAFAGLVAGGVWLRVLRRRVR